MFWDIAESGVAEYKNCVDYKNAILSLQKHISVYKIYD